MKSIKKYYLNEKNRPNFYKLDLIEEEIYKLSDNINNYFNSSSIQSVIPNTPDESIQELMTEKINDLNNLYYEIYNLEEEKKTYKMDCEIVQLFITKKGLWYTLWIVKEEEKEYYCLWIAGNRYKLYNLIKDLSLTKQYLSQKFNDIITNFIDEFDLYLNNYVNYSRTLYDNLYKYTEEKIKNNTNIQSTLNEYGSIVNNILTKNTEKKNYGKKCFK
jgi:hypothetical protein